MRRAVAALLGGSLLLAVAAGGAWQVLGQREFGEPAAAQLSGPAAVPPAPDPARVAAGVGRRSARLADLALPPSDPPAEVRVAGRSAAVVPVGLDAAGQVEVPQDVRTVGWYRFGPEPGSAAGSAVLVGHVDDAEQGRGVLADLRELEPGDAVEVRRAGGQVVGYRVVAREQWDKAEVPMERLFDPTGTPRLVLVSCAGDFDPVTRSYSDNVAVTAVPAP